VIACVLPVWIAAGFLVYYNYQSRRVLTEQRMLETARALTMVVDRELANMQASLSALSTTPSLVSGDLSAFYRQAQMVRDAYPDADILLADATGQELLNTFLPFGTPLPKRGVSDAVQQVYATGKPFITNVFKGPVSGRLLISVDVPVFRDGRVVYDLAMTVPANRFATVLSQQRLPSEWIGVIYDSNQVIVARTRLAEQFVGQPAPPALRQLMRDNIEALAEVTTLEHILVFGGFSRSATSNWTVAIAVPKAIMMAEIWRWLWWTIAGTALLSLTGIVLALPIGRSVEQIEEGSRRLRAIVESSDDAIMSTTFDGTIESWNLGAERLLGYSAPEIVGRHISILIPDDQRKDLPELMRRVRNAEVVEQYRTTRKHKNGSPISVAVKLSPIRDHLGEIVGGSAIMRDITARRRAEEQLQSTAERLKAILEHAPVGIVTNDRECHLIELNPAYQQICGYSAEELSGRRFTDLTHPEDMAKTLQSYEQLGSNKLQSYEMEKRYIRKDGKIIWVRVIASRINEKINIGIIEDITERKKAEQALRESEERFRQVVEGSPVGVYIQTDGLFRYLNPAALAMFGAEAAVQIVGRAILERIHPDDHAVVNERIRAGKEERRAMPFLEERFLRLDGTTFDVEVSASPFVFDGRNGAIVFVRDITERKQAENERLALEQQLRQAQKMEAVGKLAGGIAHDFNNILMVIQSYTEMLQDSLPAHDRLRRNTQEIMKASDRAVSLTRQMLAFSRKQILSPVVLDLNVVIDDTAKMLRRLIGEDIDFRVSSAESLWAVEADPDQIVQILMNLCVNARDAMPQGGTITITTGNVTVEAGGMSGRTYVLPGDYVRLSVTDSGVGISKELQEQIFEPFFTTKEIGKGTGLGLSTVYGIMKQSDGYLWVDSELGQGACFTIYLPRVKQAIAPGVPAVDQPRWRGTETILVAEDEEALREAVCDYLSSLGYTVLAASSGKKALSAVSEHDGHIDLLITDVVMPGMSGRELSEMLGSLYPALKTIFMSGYTDDAVLRHGIHAQGTTFLQKPFAMGTLARKVRDTLGRTETVQ
jgi:two-component system cell cycle sensor histidine kinase/response regulator CckA